jgi:hypothetical protein
MKRTTKPPLLPTRKKYHEPLAGKLVCKRLKIMFDNHGNKYIMQIRIFIKRVDDVRKQRA